jgi:hypothetical protein
VLIPAEGLAGQERVAEPLERDEGVAAALGLSQSGAQLLDAGVQVGGNLRFLAVVFFVLVVVMAIDDRAGSAGGTGSGFGSRRMRSK